MAGYFEKCVTLEGAAPHYAEWKNTFVGKLTSRFTAGVRDQGQRLHVYHFTQWVDLRVRACGDAANPNTLWIGAGNFCVPLPFRRHSLCHWKCVQRDICRLLFRDYFMDKHLTGKHRLFHNRSYPLRN